jgi:hypothetical protein
MIAKRMMTATAQPDELSGAMVVSPGGLLMMVAIQKVD